MNFKKWLNEVEIPHYSRERENINTNENFDSYVEWSNFFTTYLNRAEENTEQRNVLLNNIKKAIKVGIEMSIDNVESLLPLLSEYDELYRIARNNIILVKLWLRNENSVSTNQLDNAYNIFLATYNNNYEQEVDQTIIIPINNIVYVTLILSTQNQHFNNLIWAAVDLVRVAIYGWELNVEVPHSPREIAGAIKYSLLNNPQLNLDSPSDTRAIEIVRQICAKDRLESIEEVQDLLLFGQEEYGIEFFRDILDNSGLTNLELRNLNPYFERLLESPGNLVELSWIVWRNYSLRNALKDLVCNNI